MEVVGERVDCEVSRSTVGVGDDSREVKSGNKTEE